ncbi:MAG: hypothetical protein ACKO5K_13815 [Armatimonadota bacterium]
MRFRFPASTPRFRWLAGIVALLTIATGVLAQTLRKTDAPLATASLYLATDCPKAPGAAIAVDRFAIQSDGRFQVGFHFPNPTESKAGVQRWFTSRGLAGRKFQLDPTFARNDHAATTPEIVVRDRNGTLRYQGRVAVNGDRLDPRLVTILSELLAGRFPRAVRVPAVGCPIVASGPSRIVEKGPRDARADSVWERDIAPILRRNCVECHRAGEVGPVPLDTPQSVRRYARRIAEVVEDGTMPPWQADSHGEFHDERTLSDRDRRVLGLWLRQGGTAEPDAKPIVWAAEAKANSWELGDPDRVYALPTAYSTPAQAQDHYRCFVFPTSEDADRWIEGIEFQPGNRAAVHHISAFLDRSGAARALDARDSAPGYDNPTPGNGPGFPKYQVIGGWTPGHKPRRVPRGSGLPFPKGADLVVEVHYHLTGKSESDLSKCALHFAKAPVTRRYRVGDVGSNRFLIKAGDPLAVVEASDTLNADVTIHSITPHMHRLGRRMRITAETPSGRFVKLIDIVRWDFEWQPSYRFKEPVRLPRGTRVDVRAVYDNSANNPANPWSPPRDIAWGEGTDAEMCSVFFGYTMDSEGD